MWQFCERCGGGGGVRLRRTIKMHYQLAMNLRICSNYAFAIMKSAFFHFPFSSSAGENLQLHKLLQETLVWASSSLDAALWVVDTFSFFITVAMNQQYAMP